MAIVMLYLGPHVRRGGVANFFGSAHAKD